TFAEFLVATQTVDELRRIVYLDKASHRPATDLDDGLLRTLLSYRPLAGQSAIVGFLREMLTHADVDRVAFTDVLARAMKAIRVWTVRTRYSNYQPVATDRVREMAAYSANLVLVWLCVCEGSVDVSELAKDLVGWRSLVRLWWAGLDVDGWSAMLK